MSRILLIGGFLGGTWLSPGCAVTRPSAADNLWAQALVMTAAEDHSPEEVERLFAAALAQSGDKAPIYVSLGDYLRGPESLAGIVDEFAARVADDTVEAVGEELQQLGESPTSQEVEVLSDRLAEEWARSMEKQVDDWGEAFSDRDSRSMRCYVASTAENAAYAPAWFRVAAFGEGEVADKGADRLIAVDSDNAHAYFVKAMLEADHDRLESALEFVLLGNKQPVCRVYPFPMPTEFTVTYPAAEPFLSTGVAGQRVLPPALAYLVDAQSTFVVAPQNSRFRDLARRLAAEARRSVEQGEVERGRRWLQSVFDMGCKCVFSAPPNVMDVIVGAAVVDLVGHDLESLYKREGRRAAATKLRTTRQALMRAMETCADFVRAEYEGSEEELSARAFAGEFDTDKEREAVEAALKAAGLLQ